jgi:hypothetical protein
MYGCVSPFVAQQKIKRKDENAKNAFAPFADTLRSLR